MQKFDYTDLERLTCEVLPGRILMSLAALPVDGGSSTTTEVYYACQQTYQSGTPGLLGTGLLAQPSEYYITCMPGVVHVH